MTALAPTMPAEIHAALTEAIDRLRRAQPISARAVRRFERRHIALSRQAKQKMMALLRLAASGAASQRSAWELAREVGVEPQSCRQLPVDDARAAPPGSIVVFEDETAAVKGFGDRLYPAGRAGAVLGVFAPT